MTNNKVIIDGVDVQECTYLIKGCNECKIDYLAEINTQEELSIIYRNCKGLKNCYYKQLVRKAQECKMLEFDIDCQRNTIDNLKHEREKLKEENEQAEVWFKKACKYKSALEEIEEIAKTDCGYCANAKCPRMENILGFINKAKEQE